jgi:hypothetical protein
VATGGGYADGGLRGYLLGITGGTGAGQYGTIFDNTGSTIFVGYDWATTPDTTSSFGIFDWGSVIDGGLLLPPSIPFQTTSDPAFPTPPPSTAVPGAFGFILTGNKGSNSSPGGNVFPSQQSPIVIEGFRFTGFDGGVAAVTDTDSVEFRWNKMDNLTPNTSYAYIGALRVSQIILLSNSVSGGISLGGNYGMLGMNHNARQNTIVVNGNFFNGVSLLSSYSVTGEGALGSKNVTAIRSQLNYYLNLTGQAAVYVDDCLGCNFQSDTVQGVTGDACMRFGGSINSGSLPHNGSPASGRVIGGTYTGCTGDGIDFEGGYWDVRAQGSGKVTGTNTGYGIYTGKNTWVDFNAANGSTLTGGSGDILFGGCGPLSYVTLAAKGGITCEDTESSVANGYALTRAQYQSFCNSSGSPGNATCNTSSGRSAIASGASSITISNIFATATSQVRIQLETKDSTCTALYSSPGSLSFTISCPGSATASGNTTFSWWLTN